MKSSLLQQHLLSNHAELKDKPIDFFRRKPECVSKNTHAVHNFTQSARVALETSYELALLTAKKKKSYTAVEAFIIPGALIIAQKMLDTKSVNSIKMIPSSNTAVSRRIHEMTQVVVEQTIEKIKLDKRFAIQIDEWTDISNDAQLIVYVRYFDDEKGVMLKIFLDVNSYQVILKERYF